MIARITVVLVAVALAVPNGALANPKFAGRWNMTSRRLVVGVENWGEHCGPEPKGYSSKKVRPVNIVSQGSHLVFSIGGLRTDRCSSPNPHLQTKSQSASKTRWSRVCETPASDAKFEREEYTLAAKGNDRLEYTKKSKFDWTLKGDNCVARMVERRVYERQPVEGAADEKAETPKKPTKPKLDLEYPEMKDEKTDCKRDGAIVRLVVNPLNVEIGPQERICFKAVGMDAAGCRFKVDASWMVSQGGQEVGGLLSRSGCFKAGATAADSEGLYDVVAQAEGKQGTAQVTVSFPDLGELLRARLHPSQGLENGPDPPELKDKDTPPSQADSLPSAIPGNTAPQGSVPSDNTLILAMIVGSAIFLAATLLVIVIVLRKRSARYNDEDDWLDDDDDEPPPSPGHPASSPAAKPGNLCCPKCKSIFSPGSLFCPHDASKLVPCEKDVPKDANDSVGMVCPECHRGYDPGSRFCPHDSAKLVRYPEWKERQKGSK